MYAHKKLYVHLSRHDFARQYRELPVEGRRLGQQIEWRLLLIFPTPCQLRCTPASQKNSHG